MHAPALPRIFAQPPWKRSEEYLAGFPLRVGRMPPFWRPESYPPVRLPDGAPLPEAAVVTLGTLLHYRAACHRFYPELRAACDRASLARFTWELFESWLAARAPSAQLWPYALLGDLGDDETARRLVPVLRTWAASRRHRVEVAEGPLLLWKIGTGEATRQLLALAREERGRVLGRGAQERLEQVARRRGLTIDALPRALELEAAMGEPAPEIQWDQALRPSLAANAAPPAGWDVVCAAAAFLGPPICRQLEHDAGRGWYPHELRAFVDHPIYLQIARRLVWGFFKHPGASTAISLINVERTFRIVDRDARVDADDQPVEVPGDRMVCVMHRPELFEEERLAWRDRFASVGLAQPFPQLER